jgi:integrase
VRIPPATARPVTDDARRRAIAAADPRVALMMRLAAEAGLRRAEVAQAHTRDVLEASGGSQLIVLSKVGRTRVVPISGSLAAGPEARRGRSHAWFSDARTAVPDRARRAPDAWPTLVS